MSNKRLKIFISAYACEPHKGSEPGIGWNVVNQLAKYHEVHVLTRANNRESIENALNGAKVSPIFHYYDLPRWISFWKKKRRGYHLYYYLWQYGAFLKYRNYVNSSGFDIVQHLTFANYSMPSLFMMCHATTVYGPIGRTTIPRQIFRALPFRIRIKELVRQASMWFMLHFDLFRVFTPACADAIIECGMPDGVSSFPKRYSSKISRHPQTGINSSEPEYQTERKRHDDMVRLLICSEFLHWKGVTYSAEIFGRIARKRKKVELYIYGSGPEKEHMKSILRQYGVEDKVKWMGFVSKTEMIQALFDADILLYPSYHHGLATLILQAMYAGLPIVAMKGDPIGLAVQEGAGLVAEGKTMNEIMDDFERKCLSLIDSPDLRRQYGEKAKNTVRNYEWEKMCKRLSDILENISERNRP